MCGGRYEGGEQLGSALKRHRERLQAAGAMDQYVELAKQCFGQTMQGLQVLHASGCTHIDLKSSNVQAVVSSDAAQVHCFLIDLGSAARASAQLSMLRAPSRYMGPELATQQKAWSAATTEPWTPGLQAACCSAC